MTQEVPGGDPFSGHIPTRNWLFPRKGAAGKSPLGPMLRADRKLGFREEPHRAQLPLVSHVEPAASFWQSLLEGVKPLEKKSIGNDYT